MPCDYGCAAILIVLRRQIPHKFNRGTLGRFRPYRLPTLPKSKSRLIYIFIVNYIYQAFFWYIVSWCSVKLACVRIFSQRTLTFRSQVPWKLIRYLRIKMQFFNSEWTTVEVARACVLCKLFEVTVYCRLFSSIVSAVNFDYIRPEISTKIVCHAFGEKYISAPNNSYSWWIAWWWTNFNYVESLSHKFSGLRKLCLQTWIYQSRYDERFYF